MTDLEQMISEIHRLKIFLGYECNFWHSLLVLHVLLVSCVKCCWDPCHAKFGNVCWINWDTINRSMLQKGLNLLKHCRSYITALDGTMFVWGEQEQWTTAFCHLPFIVISPSSPLEYRGGRQSICLQSHIFPKKIFNSRKLAEGDFIPSVG